MNKKTMRIMMATMGAAMVMSNAAFAEAVTEATEAAAPEKIICMSPSSTQFLIDLGLGDKIIATDTYSVADYADGLNEGIPAFDMMTPDNEQLIALEPDLIITTGMSSSGGEDVYAAVKEAGVNVVNIDTGSSIAEVEDSLLALGEAVGEEAKATELVDAMKASIDEIKAIGESIPEEEKKSVFYEVSTPTPDYPTIYSAGKETYINEMIEVIGATNVAADQEGAWPAISEEAAIGLNPDVILTTDVYTPDVVNVLLTLTGWENVNAVMNQEVYLLDANEINRPNLHIVSAMVEMGKDIYPEAFADVADPFEATEEAVTEAATETAAE